MPFMGIGRPVCASNNRPQGDPRVHCSNPVAASGRGWICLRQIAFVPNAGAMWASLPTGGCRRGARTAECRPYKRVRAGSADGRVPSLQAVAGGERGRQSAVPTSGCGRGASGQAIPMKGTGACPYRRGVTYYLLLITYYLLPITYYLLLVTCSLPFPCPAACSQECPGSGRRPRCGSPPRRSSAPGRRRR